MKRPTRSLLIPSVIIACLLPLTVSGTALAGTEDRLLTPTATQIGVFSGVPYVQYDGIFEGTTSTGDFRVPYRITAPADPDLGNGTVLVEPPHFAAGLTVLGIYLGPDLLFSRGFAHAGVGWSTALSGGSLTQRILDPSVPGVFIRGGFKDSGGRTDTEIVADFARALGDPEAGSVLGSLSRRYVTGVSDSSIPVLDLVTSGRASNLFDLALPITTEWADPQPALTVGRYNGKLLIVNSESDESRTLVDRGVAPNQYRFYGVAGTPHIPDFLDVPFISSGTTPASWVPALRAHFLQGHRWVLNGTPPPQSYHLQTSKSGKIARDAVGNAIAVDTRERPVPRLPYVELGEARFVAGELLGSYDGVRSIAQPGYYPDHAAYLDAFRQALTVYSRAGYILAEDAADMRARAGLCPPLTFTEIYRDRYDNFVGIESCIG